MWGKWKFLWPLSSPDPRLLDGVIGLLLGYCFHTHGNKLLLTESLYKEFCPVLWAEAEMEEDYGPAACWMQI